MTAKRTPRSMLSVPAALRPSALLAALGAALLLGACALPFSTPDPAAQQAAPKTPEKIPVSRLLRKPGGFYTDDSPDGSMKIDIDQIAEPVPRAEILNASANQPYAVFGRAYVPLTSVQAYKRQGTASWYGRKFHGQKTTSGEVYDMFTLSAAHPTLPIPSFARVTNLGNGRSVLVRVNDRGPFHSGRMMDVSYAAAYKLGFAEDAIANIEVESIVTAAAPPQEAVPAPVIVPPKEPPPEAPPVTPIAAEPAGLFLQLGAFANPANAENFSARLKRELDWLAHPLTVYGRSGLYRLYLGPFKDRAEANATSKKLQEALDVKPLVIRR